MNENNIVFIIFQVSELKIMFCMGRAHFIGSSRIFNRLNQVFFSSTRINLEPNKLSYRLTYEVVEDSTTMLLR